jgi:diguanylate cyclase (GGDEF)-like protein/PAS domain S-box-containing protein
MNLKVYQDIIKGKLFNIGPMVVFIWENKENWPVSAVSKNIEKLYGYKVEDFLSSKLKYADLIHPDDIKRVFTEVSEASLSKKSFTHTPYRILCGCGEYKWVKDTTIILRDSKENITHYIGYLSDITELKEYEKQILQQKELLDTMLNTDALTGYSNRYKLNNDIQKSTNPALALIDIDNFSHLNDFYGHDFGDNIIIQLGQTIFEKLREKSCELYHLQGDEFAILNQDTDEAIFTKRISHLIQEINNTSIKLKDNENININLSTSISFTNKENLLETADMALKTAKKEHKDIVIYSDEISLNKEYENNLLWIKKIKSAIKDDRIVAVYQPIIDTKTGITTKYESLVRLKDKDEKLISPYFFLDIAKQTKHYTSITKTMIKKAFEMFQDKDEFSFSINLTIDDIHNQEINIYIIDMMKKYDIGHRVVFEIVESESIINFETISTFIKKIKNFGAKIAIDDFGTGYSNFEYLLKLDIDFIKIDGSMIKNIDKDKDAEIVVSVIVDFAKKKNIKTIAEYVETESILNKIKEMGIDYSQGYYFSEPKLTI